MPYINDVYARQVLDSRGNPTIEVEVYTESGAFGRAIVPSGASTGDHEALELRDNDKEYYLGKSVLKAVENVNEVIGPEIIGLNVFDQVGIDNTMIELDGTENKSSLGANAILAVSLACAKAASNMAQIPLYNYFGGFNAKCMPLPMMNILNGGAHANWCIDFQEIMIVPVGAQTFSACLEMGANIFHTLASLLKKASLSTGLGDEGGYAPKLSSNSEALDYVCNAIKKAGYKLKTDVMLALDVASSEFYDKKEKIYHLNSENKNLSTDEMIDYLKSLVEKYPICSIEDGLSENDWDGWVKLTNCLGNKVQLVGDDLFVTNTERLEKGIKLKAANAILIKINQIGTLTETFDCIEKAKRAGYNTIISHRSGETEDTTIADIAVGVNALQIKTGSLSRTDRIAKYNQLLRIEDELGDNAIFKGKDTFSNFN